MRIIKKIMSCALAFSLIMSPVIGTQASSTKGNDEVVSSEGTKASPETVAEIPITSSVGGTKTSVNGVYLASKVNGTAITTPIESLKSSFGLSGNEKPYAKFANMDPKKSYLAKACIDAAATAYNAEVGPLLNIEIGKMATGKYSLLPDNGASIRILVGVPKNFAKDGKTYAVVCVRKDGVVSVLADQDTNPNTVSFDIKGGAGAYAIIRY